MFFRLQLRRASKTNLISMFGLLVTKKQNKYVDNMTNKLKLKIKFYIFNKIVYSYFIKIL